jgi:hypothetical protein
MNTEPLVRKDRYMTSNSSSSPYVKPVSGRSVAHWPVARRVALAADLIDGRAVFTDLTARQVWSMPCSKSAELRSMSFVAPWPVARSRRRGTREPSIA